MIKLLQRGYAGYPVGQVVQLPIDVETALIGSGLAETNAGPVTPGAVTTNATSGIAAISAVATSVVITNPKVNANSYISAYVSQAVADTTLTKVVRIVPAAGSFTIFGDAAATAATQVAWAILG